MRSRHRACAWISRCGDREQPCFATYIALGRNPDLTGELRLGGLRGSAFRNWHEVRKYDLRNRHLETDDMGEVVRFIPRQDRERETLIRQARAIYESIFPSEKGPTGD